MEVTGAADGPSARGPSRVVHRRGVAGRDRVAARARPGARALGAFHAGRPDRLARAPARPGAAHITEGVGRVQGETGPVREVLPGDTVVVGPGRGTGMAPRPAT